MNKYILKLAKPKLNMQIKLETEKNHYKQEFGFCLLLLL